MVAEVDCEPLQEGGFGAVGAPEPDDEVQGQTVVGGFEPTRTVGLGAAAEVAPALDKQLGGPLVQPQVELVPV